MDQYVTGATIKRLREQRGLTQLELAQKLSVSDKAVSKWETGRGYPDIALLQDLAQTLGISVIELLSGNNVTNANRSCNMMKSKFYVCPICGNVVCSAGEAIVSCCGITLPPLEAEAPDEAHSPEIEKVEDEYFVSLPHEMSKSHYISFMAALRSDCCEIVKLYPEGPAQARFKIRGTRKLFVYCNRHGLFEAKLR